MCIVRESFPAGFRHVMSDSYYTYISETQLPPYRGGMPWARWDAERCGPPFLFIYDMYMHAAQFGAQNGC